MVVGALLATCSLEFIDRFEPSGWKLAGAMTPVTHIAWLRWLIATGIALLI